jgi:phosphohistidine phosphatase
MKTVIFFRHGKSDWDAEYVEDHDRPLAKRGKKAARKMGRYLARIGEVPDLIVSSTALRARKTTELAARAGDWDVEVRETRTLYDATPSEVVDVVQDLPDEASVVMLVGHEPVWSATIGLLSGSRAVRFPTAAMASIRFDTSTWADVEPGAGTLNWLVVPRSLPDD